MVPVICSANIPHCLQKVFTNLVVIVRSFIITKQNIITKLVDEKINKTLEIFSF